MRAQLPRNITPTALPQISHGIYDTSQRPVNFPGYSHRKIGAARSSKGNSSRNENEMRKNIDSFIFHSVIVFLYLTFVLLCRFRSHL